MRKSIYRSFLVPVLAMMFMIALSGCQAEDKEQEAGTPERSTDMISNPTPPSRQLDEGANTPVISFDYDSHEFGHCNEGDVMEHEFYFTNTGVGRLIITNVKPSCGCTVPYFPKEPIGQGERGSIKIEFNTEGRFGHQDKSVTVYSNATPNKVKLQFSAEVKSN